MEHPPESPSLAACLFDMDGVVTDTANAHAAAWKRLFDEYLQRRAEREHVELALFDEKSDYRRYVDGKPRYDGVHSFLRSRNIELPWGDPEDGPDRETVCGLGNRKNRYFLDWLERNRVQTYPSTLALIETLKKADLKVGVFSASRNCEAVLRNAGVHDLFQARVDGTDMVRLGLLGKPHPAMLEEAARRLGVAPEDAAVLEDSTAGVEAAARGGFGTIVGIDRGGSGEALREAGAHVVVVDAGELTLDAEQRIAVKTLNTVPPVWERWEELRRRLAGTQPVVFLDYDGTLTPIVADPDEAHLSGEMRETLAGLADRAVVAIISGRALADLRRRVGIDTLFYAGSHGFELEGPGIREVAERAEEFLPALDQAEAALREQLSAVEGHLVERKPFAIAVHYRRVADADVERVAEIVDGILSRIPALKKGHGKKVFQVQPRLDWNKGHAVSRLLEHLGLDRETVMPLYIGDDITDEDVFRILRCRGVGIVVRDGARTTSADYALADPEDVRRFLEALRKGETV